MWNSHAFNNEACEAVENITLAQQISAIKLVTAQSGQGKLGGIRPLPIGARVQVCGDGFNERTVKVRYCNDYFFVFRQDLQERSRFSEVA
jgi:hypothetical protein